MNKSNPKRYLFSLCLTAIFATPTITYSTPSSSILGTSHGDGQTVYEALLAYGLPSGLLPDTVTSYTLNADDGTFVVELSKPCYIRFDYLTYYKSRITGKIGTGSISNLSGIQVQSFFLWMDVSEIKVASSKSIYFKVGVIKQEIDAEQFQTVHSCLDRASAKACGDHRSSYLHGRKVAFV